MVWMMLGLLLARGNQLGVTLAQVSLSGGPVSSCGLAQDGWGEAKELTLPDLPQGHGGDILGQLPCA